ncbi:MAG: dephospho-CoA kinase [Halanaerobium sp.]|nr:dephospho-CoA kinase [Halanaerobium sp.]
MLVGLTGGIASGKSTAVKYLQELGARVIDSDEIAHELLRPGQKSYQKVIQEFGTDIVDRRGRIDRKKLGQIVFANPALLSKLEDLTHPLIIEEINDRVKIMEESEDSPIILDAPLLFETNLDNIVDQVWVVYVQPDIQLKRLLQRDDLTEKEAKNRIDAQLSLDEKKRLADHVLDNSGSKQELKEQIERLWAELS